MLLYCLSHATCNFHMGRAAGEQCACLLLSWLQCLQPCWAFLEQLSVSSLTKPRLDTVYGHVQIMANGKSKSEKPDDVLNWMEGWPLGFWRCSPLHSWHSSAPGHGRQLAIQSGRRAYWLVAGLTLQRYIAHVSSQKTITGG